MATLTTRDDVTLDYHTYGQGQPIILIAGYSGNQATWTAQIHGLMDMGLQVITYDRRNHGASSSVSYGMRMSRHGQDLAELIKMLQLKRPILLGHSMGASTIWAYLSLYGDDNIAAIITEDQVPVMISQKDWSYGLFDVNMADLQVAIERLPQTKLTRLKLSDEIKLVIGQNYQPFDFKFNQPLLLNSLIQDWRDVVRREQVPHLFIAGDASPLWPADHAKVASNMAPKGRYAMVKGAGHIPHLEDPVTFNTIVRNFIRELRI